MRSPKPPAFTPINPAELSPFTPIDLYRQLAGLDEPARLPGPPQSGYTKVASADATGNRRSSFYHALAYGFGDGFAQEICAAIDREIESKATSAFIAAHQKDWIRHIGECAVYHKDLA